MTFAPSRSVFSWMTMASAPSGTGAPVKMRTAWPSLTVPEKGCPAAASPMTASVAGQLGHVGNPDCVAVHGGGIERRLGDERLQRFRQHAAARLLDGDGLGLGRGHAVEDALQGFFDREQGHDV